MSTNCGQPHFLRRLGKRPVFFLGQVRGSGVSVLSESRDSVIGGVRGRLGVDVGSLGCFFGGLRVAVIEGVGGYEVSGLLQARQRHVALLLDPIIMLLG